LGLPRCLNDDSSNNALAVFIIQPLLPNRRPFSYSAITLSAGALFCKSRPFTGERSKTRRSFPLFAKATRLRERRGGCTQIKQGCYTPDFHIHNNTHILHHPSSCRYCHSQGWCRPRSQFSQFGTATIFYLFFARKQE